jgi:hypothetical protein
LLINNEKIKTLFYKANEKLEVLKYDQNKVKIERINENKIKITTISSGYRTNSVLFNFCKEWKISIIKKDTEFAFMTGVNDFNNFEPSSNCIFNKNTGFFLNCSQGEYSVR